MYYEVYVDILFLENFWMNTMLLLLTAWTDHATVRKGRIAAAAAAGSLGSCFLTIISAWTTGIFCFLGNLLLAMGMVCIAFSERHHMLTRTMLLYAECFAMNGVLRYLGQFHRLGGVWFVCFSSISFLFLMIVESIWKQRKKRREQMCSAVLYLNAYQVTVEALWDTGNSLCDPITGAPVHVLDSMILDQLLEHAEGEHIPRYIPYHTISQTGILDVYVLDAMELRMPDENLRIDHPMIARMPEKSSVCQLILHCDLLPS
ncbi:MAG: sigma-E processing peptidase SpoIIGA [Lachnospiraceae bacterium]|nr:sigma-E processing peptidase SpoIIGA [Lachnospiraceae bacterium]